MSARELTATVVTAALEAIRSEDELPKVRKRLAPDELYRLYLDRHDRITTWDMVDRAAPRVVGGYVAGTDPAPLYELAGAAETLRRRTAMTAPLYFVRAGTADDLAVGFEIAGELATDPEPEVHNAVGTFLKHAGTKDADALHRFLTSHAASMPRSALRLAIAKLDPEQRSGYLDRDPQARLRRVDGPGPGPRTGRAGPTPRGAAPGSAR